jgi:hypothetical protein
MAGLKAALLTTLFMLSEASVRRASSQHFFSVRTVRNHLVKLPPLSLCRFSHEDSQRVCAQEIMRTFEEQGDALWAAKAPRRAGWSQIGDLLVF